jgi:peptide/nickel transport system permease protein
MSENSPETNSNTGQNSNIGVVERANPAFDNSQAAVQVKRRKPWWFRLVRNPNALVGAVILLIVVLMAIFAPFLTSYNPSQARLSEAKLPPFSPKHLLGTDFSGRFVFANLVYGARVSVMISVLSVLFSGTIGIILGLVSGYYRGWLDDLINWLSNVILSFPFILLVVAVVAAIGQGVANLIIVLSLTSWVIFARVVRSETLIIREKEFIEAARAIGVRDRLILFRHILPNILTSLTVIATFEVARIIIAEAALSYLGLGVDRTTASWGKFLADNKDKLTVAWYLPIIPAIAISLTVLGINFIGDWLREEFDPRLNS